MMERLEILQKTLQFINAEEIVKINDFINQKNFFIHRETLGMMMCKVNNSFGNPFFLGEVLVCEAEVDYKESRGYGMVMGDHKELALILAAADSAIQLDDNAFFAELDKLLEPAYLRMQESLNTEKKFVSSTKVNFGLMVEG